MEFHRSLCRFCSKSMWRKICAEKICVEKNDKYEVWEKVSRQHKNIKVKSIKRGSNKGKG